MAEFTFLLWSNKHSMWWRPDARGYTGNVGEAGRYTMDAAIGHVVQSAYCGLVGQVTCMVVAAVLAADEPVLHKDAPSYEWGELN